MLNKCVIMGRFTADPELRQTQNGTSVVSFTLAVDRDRSGKDKEKKTDFISCVAWRGTAEYIAKYFTKGRQAVAAGSLQSRQFETKDGDKRTAWEILVSSVYFADSNKAKSSGTEAGGLTDVTEEEDGELPF